MHVPSLVQVNPHTGAEAGHVCAGTDSAACCMARKARKGKTTVAGAEEIPEGIAGLATNGSAEMHRPACFAGLHRAIPPTGGGAPSVAAGATIEGCKGGGCDMRL